MDQHPHLPQFGNWEGGDDIPYTAYFEKARKGRAGEKINPNDPEVKVDASQNARKPHPFPSKLKAESDDSAEEAKVRKTDHRQLNKDGEAMKFTESPAQNDIFAPKMAAESGHRRSPRHNVGSVHATERSPLHPYRQARVGVKNGGMSSPSWDGKSSHEGNPGAGGRGRMKHATSDDNLDKSAAVPKFGEWDENNPSSADGYTHIFNKVREERNTGGTKVSGANSPSYKGRKPLGSESQKGCCFPWCGK